MALSHSFCQFHSRLESGLKRAAEKDRENSFKTSESSLFLQEPCKMMRYFGAKIIRISFT